MEDFTKSMKNGRGPQVDRGAPDKGQGRLTKWAQQQRATADGALAEGEETAMVSSHHGHHGSSSFVAPRAGSPRPRRRWRPALVHRRFLVLEVTYVSTRNGRGCREKVLMALEQQGPQEDTDTAPTAAAAAAAGEEATVNLPADDHGEGTGMAQQRKITLLGDWYDCEVEPGDGVHVLFPMPAAAAGEGSGMEEEASRDVVVDNASGRLVVVHPDILVSPTKVAETVACARKAVLQSRLASDASKSKAAVMGNLKHELFETSLLAAAAAAAAPGWQGQGGGGGRRGGGRQDGGGGGAPPLLTPQYMAELVDRIVVSQLEALYGAGFDEDAARGELLSVSGSILDWHRSFLVRNGGGGGGSSGLRGPPHSGGGGGGRSPGSGRSNASAAGGNSGGMASLTSDGAMAATVAVSRVLATEDDVWSPVLGLKGIMDATVEAVVEPLVGGGGDGGGGAPSLVMPVEVKTGKRIGEANSSHRAQQVMLYTLLLRMRYGHDASTRGLLVYTAADGLHTELVSPVAAEIRALILARNRLATGMNEIGRVGLVGGDADGGGGGGGGATLPPVIRRPRECGICFQNSECMLYHRAAEGGDADSSGLEPGVFDSKVGHLSEAHLAFFSRWDRTIDLEAKIGEQARHHPTVRRTMWQESGPDRESRTQKCMSGLVWLGERERDEGFGFEAAGEAAAVAAAAVGGASNAGSKRFTHVFSREWAVPEGIAAATGGGVSAGGGGVPASGAAAAAAAATAAPPGQDNGGGNSGTPAACSERPRWAKPLKDLSLSVGGG
ncbi:unnamed protein product, partial [Ectocarpus sp. 12 AP-2014]